MSLYTITEDIPVLARLVPSFPEGISKAFDELTVLLPGGFNRPFYGISYYEGGKMKYYAGAKELFTGEAEKYDCEKLIIKKGEYLTITIHNWREQLSGIPGAFHTLVQDDRTDKTTPAVEWYINDTEMKCMVKCIA